MRYASRIQLELHQLYLANQLQLSEMQYTLTNSIKLIANFKIFL